MTEQPSGGSDPTRWPLLVGLVGLGLVVIGYLVYGLHDANMMGVGSGAEFQARTQLAGNAARTESYWNIFLVTPAELITIFGFMVFFRRVGNAPRFFKKSTTVGLILLPVYAVTQTFVRIVILAGMGRVDLGDPNHVVEPSDAIIYTIVYGALLPQWTYNIMVLLLMAMGLALLVRNTGLRHVFSAGWARQRG